MDFFESVLTWAELITRLIYATGSPNLMEIYNGATPQAQTFHRLQVHIHLVARAIFKRSGRKKNRVYAIKFFLVYM